MIELRNASSALLSLQPRLAEARDQQNSLVLSVEQRLKWAAGANPALTEVLAAFEASVDRSTDCLTTEQRLAAVVGNTCSALLHHEALRTRTPEATNQDALFLQVFFTIFFSIRYQENMSIPSQSFNYLSYNTISSGKII